MELCRETLRANYESNQHFQIPSKGRHSNFMRTAVRHLSFYILIALAVSSLAFGQKTSKNKDLPNLFEVNEHLYRGGQPTENGIKQLAQMGVKTIIDLRGEDGLTKKEEQWAADSGIKFINVSLSNWFKPKDAEIEQIIALIDKAENQPVFVHCQRGADRTGTVIAVYRMTHDGWTAKRANKEAKKFGFGWWQFWMKDYIKDYYKKLESEKKENKPNEQLTERQQSRIMRKSHQNTAFISANRFYSLFPQNAFRF
jgi:protein tyrosine phosphatase (PTP) superfamily phosphohydrolase (DUF442 family)